MPYRVESLARQCHYYILMHLEELPINQFSLLPLSMRKDLLWQLPLADICLLREDTKFSDGLDMEAFWKFPWVGQPGVSVQSWGPDRDVECYIQEWDSTEYAKAMLYGLVATSTIGLDCLGYDELLSFYSPHTKDGDFSVVSFLFAIRKIGIHGQAGDCELKFPPHYAHYSKKSVEELTMHEVVSYFGKDREELPTIFPYTVMYNSVKMDLVHFLRDVVYVGIQGRQFEEKGLEFLKALIKEATHLEVLMLGGGFDEEEDCECLDEFFTYLSSHPTFLSNFRILKILNSEYRVSRLQPTYHFLFCSSN